MLAEDLEEEVRPVGGQGHKAQFVNDQWAEAGQLPLEVDQSSVIPGPRGPLYFVFTGATPQRGSPGSLPSRAYCGDMTTWSVAGGTSPRASLSM